MRCRWSALLALTLVLCRPAAGAAQDAKDDPFSTARVRLGPLAFTPAIALSNFGVDTNVFNQWEDPRRDFTATVTPRTDAWLRMGPVRVTSRTAVDLVYFKEYSGQRSVNVAADATAELRLMRVQPFVGGSYLKTRQRPGFEIDARARRTEEASRAGVRLTLSPKTSATLEASRRRIAFDGDEVFMDTYLSEVLNRDVDRALVAFRQALTPLTTLVLEASAERERFVSSPERDADGLRVMGGFELEPMALIGGSVRVGYRRLQMNAAGMPDYSGIAARVDVGYTLRGVTRFSGSVDRDVDFSFELRTPLYVATGVSFAVTQRVGGPFDVRARASRRILDYRQPGGAGPAGAPLTGDLLTGDPRQDTVISFGGGAGYLLGPSTRLVFTVDRLKRDSSLYRQRTYRGLQAGLSVEYGF